MSLEEASSSSASTGVCPQCEPVLSKYADTFKAVMHQGSDLKRKIAVNPHPKRSESEVEENSLGSHVIMPANRHPSKIGGDLEVLQLQ